MRPNVKKIVVGACTFSAIAFLSSQALATTLSFMPSTLTIDVNGTVNVDVVISELGGSYVSAFEFDVNYDDTALTFNSYSLTGNLGDISLFEADDWSGGDLGFGSVNLVELSYLWDLTSLQDGTSMTLGTLSFTGAITGTSGLSFANVLIGDDIGGSLDVSLSSGVINVASPVPEPATMILLGTALAGLAGARRRQKA